MFQKGRYKKSNCEMTPVTSSTSYFSVVITLVNYRGEQIVDIQSKSNDKFNSPLFEAVDLAPLKSSICGPSTFCELLILGVPRVRQQKSMK